MKTALFEITASSYDKGLPSCFDENNGQYYLNLFNCDSKTYRLRLHGYVEDSNSKMKIYSAFTEFNIIVFSSNCRKAILPNGYDIVRTSSILYYDISAPPKASTFYFSPFVSLKDNC